MVAETQESLRLEATRRGQDFVALEPMTAQASALTSGRGLRVVEAGQRFQAVFRIGIQA